MNSKFEEKRLSMRTRIVRAIVAALIAGALLIAGAAPYADPGLMNSPGVAAGN